MRPSCLPYALFFTATLTSPVALAQSDKLNAASGLGLAQIISALAIVIGLMLFLAFIVKRWAPLQTNNKLGLKLVASLSIGQRERIVIIEVADQWLVLGVSAQSINTLHSLPKQESETPVAHSKEIAFSQWLKKTLEKQNSEPH